MDWQKTGRRYNHAYRSRVGKRFFAAASVTFISSLLYLRLCMRRLPVVYYTQELCLSTVRQYEQNIISIHLYGAAVLPSVTSKGQIMSEIREYQRKGEVLQRKKSVQAGANRKCRGMRAAAALLAGILGAGCVQGRTVFAANESGGSMSSITQADGLQLKKTVTQNENGSWHIALESYVMGETRPGVHPVDIVLLLDTSGSMQIFAGRKETGVSRQESLQIAAREYVAKISECNEGVEADQQSRIALVQFADDDDTRILQDLTPVTADNREKLNGIIDALPADGSTRIDCAMEAAADILERDDKSDRQKSVILMTDGQPSRIDGFQPSIANAAIKAAKGIKESGAEIYTISMEPNCYADTGGPLPEYEKDEKDTEENEDFYYVSPCLYYREDQRVNCTDENMTNMTNRFFHLISSNNPRALSMDVPDAEDENARGSTSGGGDGPATYYSMAESGEALVSIYEDLAYSSVLLDSYLGSEAQLRDFVTDDFEIRDPESVKIYTSGADVSDGTLRWKEKVPAEFEVSKDAHSVRVKGFDYSRNFVCMAGHPDNQDYAGAKLIVEFDIESAKTFGGSQIPTNGPESGVYRNEETQEPACLFGEPRVDLPIDYEVAMKDKALYVPEKVQLQELTVFREGYRPDGRNNAHVEIRYTLKDERGTEVGTLLIPAGVSADACTWQMKETTAEKCGRYDIECRITPVKEGSVKEKKRESSAEVHIYHPVLALKDSVQTRGEEIDLQEGDLTEVGALGPHFASIDWICDDDTVSDPSNEPYVIYRTAVLSGCREENGRKYIDTAGDIPVSLYLLREGAESGSVSSPFDISDWTDYRRSCVRSSCNNQGSKDAAFLIHSVDEGNGEDENKDGEDHTQEKAKEETKDSGSRCHRRHHGGNEEKGSQGSGSTPVQVTVSQNGAVQKSVAQEQPAVSNPVLLSDAGDDGMQGQAGEKDIAGSTGALSPLTGDEAAMYLCEAVMILSAGGLFLWGLCRKLRFR